MRCHIYYITSVILYIYSGYVTASEYYVSAAPNGEDCPSDNTSCYNLSYYVADYSFYFTDDTIFYFLNETHSLQGILNISNVSNITLQGQDHIEQGFHETVMQSTSVIMCSDSNRTGIRFSSSRNITIKSLTIANCGFDNYISYEEIPSNHCGPYRYQHHRVSLFFVNISNVTLEHVSVQNSSGHGLVLVNTYDVLIDNSSFANNGASGIALIVYDAQPKRLSRVIILKSNFTLGLGYGMSLWYGDDNEADVIIENSIYSYNNAWSGGGVNISLHGGGSIEFDDCIICNNTAQNDGGGVDIYTYGNASIYFNNCNIYNNTALNDDGGGVYTRSFTESTNIEFFSCTIYNNTAQDNGGGVYFNMYGNCSIKFSKCIIYDNTAQNRGGGVSIYRNGNGSIEFNNCTIYNNTARYWGGGVNFIMFGNCSIEFSKCIIYDNTAQYDGGGVGIYMNGNGSIDFSNCTIYSNIAWYDGGGVDFFWYGDYSIEFSNCVICDNTARDDGGGVGVYTYGYGNGNIDFSNCKIYNNTAQYDDGGGIFIHSFTRSVTIEFFNCNIYDNTAQYWGGGVYFYSYGNGSIEFNDCALYNNTAWYNGGGVYITSNGNGSIDFSNCKVYNNTSQDSSGGGIYIRSYRESVSIEFFKCTIYNNTAQYNGGGVDIHLYSESSNITFINCAINCNNAKYYGGGVSTYLNVKSNSNVFSNCNISNNSAYLGSGLVLHSFQSTSTSSFHFTNVAILFNKVMNNIDAYQNRYKSAVVLINVTNVTLDEIQVISHNSTGLVAENSLIKFNGDNMFVNNSGINGGGIALYESSQLIINQNANISFINNHASESGGGIFVSQVLGLDITNECSFKVIPYHDPNDIKTLLYFVNNTADISGDVLYGGKIDDCTRTLYFDHLFYYPQQTGLSVVTSDPIQACFCELNKPNCSITNISIFAIPGIDVNIPLATVGLKDSLTKGAIKLTSSDNTSIVQYNNNRLNANCTNITFKIITNPSLNTTQVYATLETSIRKPLSDPYANIFEVTIEPCPNGYPLVNDTCVCRFELNSDSITCDNNTLIITRIGDMWIGYENDSNCLIVYPNCPFDYCNNSNISFTLNYHNKQCLHGRSGILCGQCSKNLSLMLGSNQCGNCTNDHIALIIPFAFAGIALVAFVMVLNLTVSVGTINGLIFYANVVKMYEHVFFPNGPIPFLSWFISWVNLDLGINTCFYHTMDSCSKAWLQFVFPVYIWLILLVIIILLRYSTKVVRLVGRQIIPVIATMILFSYTKLIRTVVQALYWVEIPCIDDDKNNTISLLRWYFDANVHYLEGCHLPLFLFSSAVLILLIIPYSFYLLTIPLFEGPLSKYMCFCQKLSTNVKPFFDAYGGPYKDKCRFWTGFLLLLRVILALVVSLNINSIASYDVLASILIIIILMYFILKGIYRHILLEYLEKFFILNLMFMTYMNSETSNKNNDSKRQWSSFVSVLLTFIVFCGIILYHVWDRLMFFKVCDRVFRSHWQQQIAKVKRMFKKPPPPSTCNDMELPLIHPESSDDERRSISMSVLSVEMEREAILFDQDD